MKLRTFKVVKYVAARNVVEAIKKSAKIPIGEVIDMEDRPKPYGTQTTAIGYQLDRIEDEEPAE